MSKVGQRSKTVEWILVTVVQVLNTQTKSGGSVRGPIRYTDVCTASKSLASGNTETLHAHLKGKIRSLLQSTLSRVYSASSYIGSCNIIFFMSLFHPRDSLRLLRSGESRPCTLLQIWFQYRFGVGVNFHPLTLATTADCTYMFEQTEKDRCLFSFAKSHRVSNSSRLASTGGAYTDSPLLCWPCFMMQYPMVFLMHLAAST